MIVFGERPLLAESGSQNLVFPAFLMSGFHAKAAIRLESAKRAANDPKQSLEGTL